MLRKKALDIGDLLLHRLLRWAAGHLAFVDAGLELQRLIDVGLEFIRDGPEVLERQVSSVSPIWIQAFTSRPTTI